MRSFLKGAIPSGLYVGLCFCMLIAALPLWAQTDTGTILGTVADQTGAVIPGAKVTLTNEGTNLTSTTTTGGDGGYVFTPVKIGTYTITVEAAGFSKAVQTHLTLNINESLKTNITLKPGQVTQTVEVTAAAPALQTENASVGQVVNQQSVNNLPLNGRNFTFLAQTVAGVNTPQADTRGNAATGAFAANGLRPAQNNYLLDGIDNNEDTVDFLNGTNFVVLPPIDAIQEFKVQTSDYSAQFGRAGAAIVNATIKSGTNQIHGDVFEFLRNDALDAADFFENAGGIQKGAYRQNQFGATIGGPIVIPHVYNGKDKLFFFGDYEGLRRRQGTVFVNSVPTQLERNSGYTDFADLITGQSGSHTDDLGRTFPYGTIFDPASTRAVGAGVMDPVSHLVATNTGNVRDPIFATPQNLVGVSNFTTAAWLGLLNQIPMGRLDTNAVNLLNVYPTPNNGNLFSNFTDSPGLRETRDAFDVRVDYNRSDKDQIFARFSYVNDPQFIPGPFSGIADGGAFQQGDQTANSIQPALGWTHTFSPTLVNEARLGVNRIGTSRTGPVSNELGIPEKYGIQGVPQVSLNGGLPAFGINGLNTLGSNAFLPSDEVSQTTQLTDNLTKIYGKHSFKMGIEFQRVKYSTLQPPWSHGEFDYGGNYTNIPEGSSDNTGRAQFVIAPIPSTVGGPNYVGGSSDIFTSNISLTDNGKNYWGTYFEDDWKINSKLTLNLGLRWDYFGQTFEHFGAQANWVPGTPGSGGGAEGTGAQYLIPSNRQSTALSTSFTDLAAADGITIKYTSNRGLGVSQKGNFSPRVGFAYQWNSRLVVRGGFGIFYGGFENRGFSPNLGENYPFQFNFNYSSPNGETPTHIPNSTISTCGQNYTLELGFTCTPLETTLVNAEGLGLRGIQYNYITPYTMGYNLTFQYQVDPSVTISLGYVGNQVRHLEVFPNANGVSQILPTGTCLVGKNCSPAQPVAYVPYIDFSASSYAATEGNSHYDSLQTSVEKRYAAGLNFLGTYTYSRARSDSGDLLNGNSIGYRAPYLPGFGIQGDYGDADFDIRQVFHFTGGYELPFGKGKPYLANASGATNQIVGGWSMQWIATVQGGQPMTIGCDTGTTSGLGCNALLVPGQNRHGDKGVNGFLNNNAFTQPCPLGFSATTCAKEINGLGNNVPWPVVSDVGLLGGTNSETSGPGIWRLDYSLFKNFQLSERFRMEFRSEFFNVFNHPTFNAPGFGGNGVVAVPGSTDILSSNFGKIGSTRFPNQDSRQIQFALKLYF